MPVFASILGARRGDRRSGRVWEASGGLHPLKTMLWGLRMPDRFLHTAVAQDVYQQAFDRLLRDLQAAERPPEGSRPVG
jgi:hypothetical protein